MNKILLPLLLMLFCGSVRVFANGADEKIIITEIMSANIDQFISPATNFDGWIELFNPTSTDMPLAKCYISNDKANQLYWQFPEGTPVIPANGYYVIWFNSNDINPYEPPFRLDVDGGSIFISNDEGSLIASITYPKAINRTSYSMKKDGTWGTTSNPTPGTENCVEGYYNKQLKTPNVRAESQVFSGTLEFEIEYPQGAVLKYTTDGSLPTQENGETYTTGKITISENACFRARAFMDGFFSSEPVTRSFIKKEYDFDLPILSVISQDNFLYDDYIGILVKGVNGRIDNGSTEPCNWNMNWERPSYFSFMKDGKSVFDQEVLMEVFGHYSRRKDIKSIKLKGNKLFGKKNLNYPFFSDKPYINNRTLVLRNGGSYYGNKLKDALLETLILKSGMDVDVQGYQPVMYFLNGKFIGLMNLREPTNKHFVYANYGLDEEDIDMFEMNQKYFQLCGDDVAYTNWFNLAKNASNSEAYQEILNLVDIDEYINYLACHLFLSIQGGWPLDNTKCYRERNGGRFRYVSYDMDAAFMESPMSWLAEEFKNYSPAEIFINMLQNELFRKKFIDTYCIAGGSVYEKTTAEKIIDELANRVRPIMDCMDEKPEAIILSLKEELQKRRESVVNDLRNFSPLELTTTPAIKLQLTSNLKSSDLLLNGVSIPYQKFDGNVFLPAKLSAVAPLGVTFLGWRDKNTGEYLSRESEIEVETDLSLEAIFEPITTTPVIVNEISAANDSYVNDYFKKGDWIELYNTTSEPIDIQGMYLSNDEAEPLKYRFSYSDAFNTIIGPYDYLVVWCDNRESLSQLHVPFNLDSGGGKIVLTASDMSFTDIISYSSMSKNETIARYPDGGGIFRTNRPTIGKTNTYTSYLVEEKQTDTGISMQKESVNDFDVFIKDNRMIIKTDGKVTVNMYTVSGYTLKSDILQVRRTYNYMLDGIQKGFYIIEVDNNRGNRKTYKLVY